MLNLQNRFTVMDIGFDRLTMEQVLEKCRLAISKKQQKIIVFANPEFVMEAQKNAFLRDYLKKSDIVVADGQGVLWAAKIFKDSLPERVTGTDFVPAMAALSAVEGYTIYFLGGRPGVAEGAARNLATKYPGCRIVGTQHGYFGPDEEMAIISDIQAKKPDFLMVCLGNPRQEEWIARHRASLPVPIIFGNGGALDFASGSVKRAPVVMQRLGLEFIFRLQQDFNLTRIKRVARVFLFGLFVVWRRLTGRQSG